MISFEKACAIALAYYRDNHSVEGIYKPYELDDCWVFNGGHEGDGAVGIHKIAVAKADGAVSAFSYPTRENVERLRSGRELPLPDGIGGR